METSSTSQSPSTVASFLAGTGDKLTVFSDYRAWVAQLIADLDRAEHEIVMEMYTFEPDGEGGDVADALLRAAYGDARIVLPSDTCGASQMTAAILLARSRLPVSVRWTKS
jgi:phosphatidylserine/phosphatidylglycerophosphate/cardiolipin synthase-like enzyme